VEEIDPSHPVHGPRFVQAKTTAGSGRGLEQPELLVEVDRPDRLAGLARQIADANQVAVAAGLDQILTLTLGLDCARNVLDSNEVGNYVVWREQGDWG